MDAPYAKLEPLQPGIARLLASNPSPFTFTGTQSYVLGEQQVTRGSLFDDELDIAQLLTELARQPVDEAGHFFANILMIHRG